MSDSQRGAPARGLISLIPGVIYEWTPDGIALAPDDDGFSTYRGPASFRAGDEPVPGYRLVRRIGLGATGEVWEAAGPGGVAVALKFVEGGRKGATHELGTLAALPEVRHANLITLFGIWEHDGWAAIGMDLADGSLLDRFEEVRAGGAAGLGLVEAVELLRQAALGIDFLNEPRHARAGQAPASLVHRDIKPQNLLVVGPSVKVGDFGLIERVAAESRPPDGRAGDGLESLMTAYSAPEVRLGGVSTRSDQYSLAATYCHLRGGRPPAVAADPSGPADLAMLPPEERPAVARALAPDPTDRWPSCSAFVAALAASARGAEPAPLALGPPAARAASRRVDATTGLLAAGLLVAAALAWSARPRVLDVPLASGGPPVPPSPVVPREPTRPVTLVEPPRAEPPVVPAGPPPVVEPAPAVPDPAPVVAEAAPRVDPEVVVASPPVDLAAPEVPIVAEPSGPTEGEVRALVDGWLGATRDRLVMQVGAARRLVGRAVAALPRIKAAARPSDPPAPKTATIIVRLPSSKAELVVRGEVGRGNPDEWYGPRRVIHSPPLAAAQDYLIGAFWTDPDGRPMTRSLPLKVKPGGLYEVDLRGDTPSAVEVPHPPAP